VVVAYGMILPQAILDTPSSVAFNLHASLLPRWRGAAPINRAIMAGDAETGVMVMKMDAGLDTGDVAMAERMAITDAMTAADLHDALAPLGGSDGAGDGRAGTRQTAVHETKRRRDLRRQNRKGRGADRLEQACARRVASYSRLSPFPGAWCEISIEGEPARVKSCVAQWLMVLVCQATSSTITSRLPAGKAPLRILELQRAGKAPMKAGDFCAARR